MAQVALASGDPGAGPVDALGQGVDAQPGPFGVGQPVDGQPPGDVVDRGADPRDLRVIGVPVGHEELVETGADQLGQRHVMLQAERQGDGVGADQAGRAGAVLAPVDEDLAEAPVVPLVGGEQEGFGADGDGGGVSDAAPGQVRVLVPSNTYHHGLASELVYEMTD